MGAVGTKNGFFVTLTENEYEVACFGKIEGFLDGFFAVKLKVEIFAFDFAGFFGALDELVGDNGRIFVTGIVFGDDDDVAMLTEDFSA